MALVLVFLGSAAKFYQIGFIQQLDNILYDYRLRLTMPRGVDDRIVILDIDGKKASRKKVAAVEPRSSWPADGQAI
ncbi:MAG: hypothetical protein WDM70_06075 [Nitrosomonadales bacterium]